MRKKYFYLAFLFSLFTTISFAQKVILTPTVVNGASISTSGPINLGGTPNSSVSLGVIVEMPAIPGNTGTISIYSIYGFNANVVIGGNGGILIFNEGKVASRSFVVNLKWSDFQTSGGYIYAEYKTASGVAYKSGYISVVKNATMGGGTINPPADAPNPSKITNTLCCNQTVRLGEKPAPITGSQYLNPYENYIYGVNSRWTVDNGNIVGVDNVTKTLYPDYTTQLKNITIKRFLGYNGASDLPNGSNTITITVVPSPITSNEISIDASIDENGFYEIINSNPKEITGYKALINLNILKDPFYIPKRGDASVSIERYEWEYNTTNQALGGPKNWTTIPNQNYASLNSSFLPNLSSPDDSYYLVRRIAIYNDLKITSPAIKIVLRTVRSNNTICCDQILQVSSSNEIEKPTIITGPVAISNQNQYLFYQWQSQSIINQGKASNWSNIPGATSKDYQPSPLAFIPSGGRGTPTVPTYNYRRIATTNYYNGEKYYSNEITLTPSTNIYSVTSSISVYPNPSTTIINIANNDNTYNLSDSTIRIVSILGIPVNPNNLSVVNPNLISINTSDLVIGTYFINISSTKGNRTYTEQFTFLKN